MKSKNFKGLAGREPGKKGAIDSAAGVEPSSTSEVLGWCQTEIGAGMVLKLDKYLSPEERAHNNACDRAKAIIQNYRDGFGLFQMTRRLKSTALSGSSADLQIVQPTKKGNLKP